MQDEREFACSLGADAAIAYTRPGWSQAARDLTGGSGVDIIYESVGGAVTKEGLKALAPLGRLVIYGSLERWDAASASMPGAAAISRI
uniref:zinc-binding dehydrogenase n=1 Tax=Methylosinus sp. LW4 TaxID=136993 RepID=UPI0009FBD9A7|nr:zinc-binding dehydrogenase [Methylosinus sp. LW4]